MSRTQSDILERDWSSKKADLAHPLTRQQSMDLTLDETPSESEEDSPEYIDVDSSVSEKPKLPLNTPATPFDFKNISIWILGVIIIGIGIGIYAYKADAIGESKAQKDCSFETLKEKYPKQSDVLWKMLQIGINSTTIEPQIYLFAYMDQQSTSGVINDIVQSTGNCLQTGSNPLMLSHRHFEGAKMEEDYGIAIDEYRKPLEASLVMLVTDIDKISAKVAQAFHTICDTHTPFVERSFIFLTIRIESKPDGPILKYVETKLRNDWNSLEENKLQPLVSRVTDLVLLLN